MNLQAVKDSKYIKDHGLNAWLEKIFDEVKITDSGWDKEASLFEYADEHGIPFKKVCVAVDKLFPKDTDAWANQFCNYVDDMAESLDSTIVETVEHSVCEWDDAVGILDELLSPEQKQQVIAKLGK